MPNQRQCPVCDQCFTRNEHLERHVLSHTKEKPYSCPFCRQEFQRKDVQVRHVKKHCPSRPVALQEPGHDPKKQRVRVACSLCHERKLRCDGTLPCHSCQKKGQSHLCNYDRELRESQHSPSVSHKPAASGCSREDESQISQSNLVRSGTKRRVTDVTSMVAIQGTGLVNGGSQSVLLNPALTQPAEQSMEDQEVLDQLTSNSNLNMYGLITGGDAMPGVLASPVAGALSDSVMQEWYESEMQSTLALPTSFMDINMLDQAGNWGMVDSGPSCFQFYDFMSLDSDNPALDSGTYENMRQAFGSTGCLNDKAEAALDRLAEHLENTRSSSPILDYETLKWLRRPLLPNHYDQEVLNILQNVFLKHVAPFFTSYLNYRVGQHTRPEQILAMSAVGALFCQAKDSFKMARALYNDARWIPAKFEFPSGPNKCLEIISLAQALIAQEIFGICSGDKRSYEQGEALHLYVLEVFHEHGLLSPSFSTSSSIEEIRQKLVNDVYLLNFYRLCFIQVAPNLFPTWRGDFGFQTGTRQEGHYPSSLNENILRSVAIMMTPRSRTYHFNNTAQSTYCLAGISLLAFHSMIPSDNNQMIETSLWRREFFELALDRWLQAQAPISSPSIMVLFHISLLLMHVNMEKIHGLARLSVMDREADSTSLAWARAWRTSEDCEVSIWHATEIIEFALQSERRGLSGQGENQKLEAPHTAMCLYLAVLILWASEVARETPDRAAVQRHLEVGISVLGHCISRNAVVLANVLEHLRQATL